MLKNKNLDLPSPPTLKQTLGPSFILLGLALGSGELIMWPYLSARYGLGLIWGGLLGITFQYILNTEIMRYSLAWGESVFVGFKRLSSKWPIWFILSTFIPWSLPGFSSASAKIIKHILNIELSERNISIILLLITGIILTTGKTLYKTMEFIQRSVIMIGLPLILYLSIRVTSFNDWFDLFRGMVGMGDGWWFFPSGIALGSFLGAFAYSGAGGNLNLTQSYYVKEKGLGMGKYGGKITSLFSKQSHNTNIEGNIFRDTEQNRKKWSEWWKLVATEHLIVFWGLGLITIVLLALLSKALVYGNASSSGIEFLFQETTTINNAIGNLFGILFLSISALMLFSTQIGVLESSSRIISENILLLKLKKQSSIKPNLSKAFYIALWGQILLGIVLLTLGIQEPRMLLTLGAILNAVAMMISFPLIYMLNKSKLPKFARPKPHRVAIILIAFLFFLFFVILTLKNALIGI